MRGGSVEDFDRMTDDNGATAHPYSCWSCYWCRANHCEKGIDRWPALDRGLCRQYVYEPGADEFERQQITESNGDLD